MKPTYTEKERAIKKVHIAIDKMVDLQDMGFGTVEVQEILDKLNALESSIYNMPTKYRI